MNINKFTTKKVFVILIFVIYFCVRLFDIGHDNFNTDVWKWKARSYDFGSGIFNLDFEKTVQKYHPGVSLMWLGTFGIKIYNFYLSYLPSSVSQTTAVFGLDLTQKIIINLCLAFSFAIFFSNLSKILNLKKALFVSVFLMLEPFYLGLTRVIHLEGLLTTFLLVSITSFYLYRTSKNKQDLLLSSIFAALAVLTKTSSLMIVGFIFVGLIFRKDSHIIDFIAPVFFKWIVGFLLTFFILWPATWTHLPLVISTLARGVFEIGVEEGHEQIFFSKYTLDPGPFFYFVVLAFKSSVLYIVGFLLSLYLLFKKAFDGTEAGFIKYLLLFSIMYLVEMIIPTKKLDRYILPTFMTVGIIFYLSLYTFIFNLKERSKKVAMFFSLFFMSLTLIYIHPDYFSYFNPLLGGLRTGMYVLEPKWLIGGNDIIEFFKNESSVNNYAFYDDNFAFEKLLDTHKLETALTVAFPEKYYTQIWPFFREIGGFAVISDLSPFAVKTKYFVFPVWEDRSAEEDRFKLIYYKTIEERGTPIYNVYIRQ